MPNSLQVLYPAADGTRFDFDYYLGRHMEVLTEHMGAHIDRTLVTRGLAGGPDTPAGFHAVATIVFADQAAMDAAMAQSAPVVADIANFTDTRPVMLIGEVIG